MGDDLHEEDWAEGGCLNMQQMLAGGQNSMAKILRQVIPGAAGMGRGRLPRILKQQKKREEEEEEEERVRRQRVRLKSKSVLLKRHVQGGKSRKVRFQLEQPKGGSGGGDGLESLRRRLDNNLKLQQQGGTMRSQYVFIHEGT